MLGLQQRTKRTNPMFLIEPIAHAPAFLKEMADKHGLNPTAVAMIRDYDKSHAPGVGERHPALRDRRDEVAKMLRGMVGYMDADVTVIEEQGRDLHRNYGFQAVGAQFAHHFVVLFV